MNLFQFGENEIKSKAFWVGPRTLILERGTF